jgi:hypothetical protein
MLRSVSLKINFDKIPNSDDFQHNGSCAAHQVSELSDIHEQYSGFLK